MAMTFQRISHNRYQVRRPASEIPEAEIKQQKRGNNPYKDLTFMGTVTKVEFTSVSPSGKRSKGFFWGAANMAFVKIPGRFATRDEAGQAVMGRTRKASQRTFVKKGNK